MRPIILLFIAIAVGIIACHKEAVSIDPNVAILGKWEITHDTFGPVENPLVYEEYLRDSILLVHDYHQDIIIQKKYWFSDSLLYKRRVYAIDDSLHVIIEPFRYEFLDHNSLRLDLQWLAMNTTFTYKRIK